MLRSLPDPSWRYQRHKRAAPGPYSGGDHLLTSYQMDRLQKPNWSCPGNSKGRRNWKKSRLRCHRRSRHPKSGGDLPQDAPSHFGPALMTATPSAFVGDAPREQCHLQSQPHNCRQMQSWRDRQSTAEIRYSSPQGVLVLGAPGPTCTFILVQEHWSLSKAEE